MGRTFVGQKTGYEKGSLREIRKVRIKGTAQICLAEVVQIMVEFSTVELSLT